ncbi:hypothetical protein E3N88_09849 [Mikania micrantha]|uniref:Aminotransferase-like plant mobile domain-containing protein n=1 Tax=Mikania micrantha TaxID=192012 RepID=A0A5N6PMJ1_9ASTR|nr:hypothetical protein E3N88_09849 [Mikania micrantha]
MPPPSSSASLNPAPTPSSGSNLLIVIVCFVTPVSDDYIVHNYLVQFVEKLDEVDGYAWGAALLSTFYCAIENKKKFVDANCWPLLAFFCIRIPKHCEALDFHINLENHQAPLLNESPLQSQLPAFTLVTAVSRHSYHIFMSQFMRSRLRTRGTAFLMLMVEEGLSKVVLLVLSRAIVDRIRKMRWRRDYRKVRKRDRNQKRDSARDRGRQGRPRKRLGSTLAAIGGNTTVSGVRGDRRRKSRWPWRSELTGGG